MASQAFRRNTKIKRDVFEKSKQAKANEYSLPDLEGSYNVSVGCVIREFEKDDDVIPIVKFPFTVEEGDQKGTKHFVEFWLSNEDEKREQKAWDGLSRTLQVLLGGSIDDLDLDDLEATLQDIEDDRPLVRINVQPSEYNGKTYLNVYFNEFAKRNY